MAPTFKIQPSNPYPLGIRREDSVIFASMISATEDCGILLYRDAEETEEPIRIPFPAGQRVGMVYSMEIRGIPAHYKGYRLYRGSEITSDVHGKRYKRYEYGRPMADSDMMGLLEPPQIAAVRDESDCQVVDGQAMAGDKKACQVVYGRAMSGDKSDPQLLEWENDVRPRVALSDAVIYGLHVRGFTMDTSSGCRYKGTFKGIIEKLDYLQNLGITSILLMPAYEFIEKEVPVSVKGRDEEQSLVSGIRNPSINYWGYKKGYYYAPKASYAAGENPCLEMKQLVKACHEKGMELWMQFYFPGDIPAFEAVRILEYWVQEYHIDGFRISAECLDMKVVIESPVLADTKLISADLSEAGISRQVSVHAEQTKRLGDVRSEHGGHRHASAAGCLIEEKYLGIFRDDVTKDYRRFIRGDEFCLDGVMYHFRKNSKQVAYINSIADYQGFRLADLVSYDYKHNEANGERNTDGSNYNYSWNCGVEGSTGDENILRLRRQQMKNALSLVFLSQGTPYIFMGDEMGQSQKGNNNPYNQDNAISWLDWSNMDKNEEIYLFTKELIAYRKAHPILHMEEYLEGMDFLGCGYPNISFHGLEAYRPVTESYRREIGILLCGKYACDSSGKEDKLIYIACNMHGQAHTFELPRLYKGLSWQIAMITAGEAEQISLCSVCRDREENVRIAGGKKTKQKCFEQGPWQVTVPARSIVVLEA